MEPAAADGDESLAWRRRGLAPVRPEFACTAPAYRCAVRPERTRMHMATADLYELFAFRRRRLSGVDQGAGASPADGSAIRPQGAGVGGAAADSLEGLTCWRRSGAPETEAPAQRTAVFGYPAGMVETSAQGHEGVALRGRFLTVVVYTPADHRPILPQCAAVLPARAYLQEPLTGRRR